MMLDLLDLIGRAAWEPLWVPILTWTAIALPLWFVLLWTDQLHPRAEYRLSQVLLAALPIGLLATVLVDLLPGSLAVASARPLPVTGPLLVETSSGAESSVPTWQWTQAVGLLTVGAAVASLARLCSLVRDAVATVRVRSSLDCCAPAPIQARTRRVARRLGLNRPLQVCVTPDAPVPVTLGGWKPIIVLPAGLADDPDDLRMALVHECIHVRRYDDLAHLLERVVTALFDAHPLVARLREHVVEARERACDAAVLTESDPPTAQYARLLLSFADGIRPQGLDAPTLSESPSALTTRLHAMRSSAPRWLSSPFPLVTGLLTLGAVVVFGVVACSDGESPSPLASDESSPPKSIENVETPPSPRGGMQALRNELQYPEMVKKAGIEGTVFVQFVVDENGEPGKVRVKNGVHRALDSAAVRAIRSVAFEPGKKQGTPVSTEMVLPVNFKIPEESSASSASADSGNSVTTDLEFVFRDLSSPDRDRLLNGPVFRPRTATTLVNGASYPDLIRKAGIEGTVEVTFTMGEDGRPREARITKSVHEALDAKVLRSVQNTLFETDQSLDLAGKTVSVRLEYRHPES